MIQHLNVARAGHAAAGTGGCAVEQQDAADEVRAFRWRPSQLILVFCGP